MSIKKTIKRKNSRRYRHRLFKYKTYKTYKTLKTKRKSIRRLRRRHIRRQRGGSETSRATYPDVSMSGSKITSLNGEDPALQSGDLSINPGLLNALVGGGSGGGGFQM